MTAHDERIAQFRKMANDDPTNELGHFRLGQLLMEAGEFDEAIKSFRRTLELSPQFSKVYQLLGGSLMKSNRLDEAVQVLREGFAIADERGDNIPRDEMVKLLKELGEEPPASTKVRSDAVGDGFRCQRPGCEAEARARQLARPPMSDETGRRIYETVCADCWEYWLKNMSVKVINELRLDLSTEQGQDTYDQNMRLTLGLS